ncbi:MAG: hypothetical protein ACOX3L_13290 [Lutisporaceae bacterium]
MVTVGLVWVNFCPALWVNYTPAVTVRYEPSYFSEFVAEVNDNISKEEMLKINVKVLKKLMNDITRKDTLDLGLARHILRRSSKLRSRAILKQLLANFDFFVPVLRDICLYLDKVTTQSMIERNISLFENIVTESNVINFPYVKYWMKYYFVSYPYFMNSNKIKKYVLNEENYLSGAIYAKNVKNIAWIRKYKNKLTSLNTWDRRAIMYSSLGLPRDERRKWMEHIRDNTSSILEKILAMYLLTY